MLFSPFLTDLADYICDVRDCGARGRAQVQDLAAGPNVNVLYTADNGGSHLGAEGIPHAVFHLFCRAVRALEAGRWWGQANEKGVYSRIRNGVGPQKTRKRASTHGIVDADALFAVHRLAWHQIAGAQRVVLALGHKDAWLGGNTFIQQRQMENKKKKGKRKAQEEKREKESAVSMKKEGA